MKCWHLVWNLIPHIKQFRDVPRFRKRNLKKSCNFSGEIGSRWDVTRGVHSCIIIRRLWKLRPKVRAVGLAVMCAFPHSWAILALRLLWSTRRGNEKAIFRRLLLRISALLVMWEKRTKRSGQKLAGNGSAEYLWNHAPATARRLRWLLFLFDFAEAFLSAHSTFYWVW